MPACSAKNWGRSAARQAHVEAVPVASQPFAVEGGGRVPRSTRMRDRPRRSIASAYRSAASPSSARSARERAATPSARSVPLAAVKGFLAQPRLDAYGQLTRAAADSRLDQLGHADSRMSFKVAKLPSSSRRIPRSTSDPASLKKPSGSPSITTLGRNPCAGWFDRLFDVGTAPGRTSPEVRTSVAVRTPRSVSSTPSSGRGTCAPLCRWRLLGGVRRRWSSQRARLPLGHVSGGSVAYAKTSSGGRSITTDASTLDQLRASLLNSRSAAVD